MRLFAWMVMVMALCGAEMLGAAADAARAAAERDAAEERYRILRSSFDDLQNSHLELKRRLDRMTQTLERLSADIRNVPGKNTFVTRSEFDALVETVREIDRKRESDKKQVLANIDKLGRSLSEDVASALVEANRAKPKPPPRTGSQQGVSYKVQSGNTLYDIINAHNAEFKAQGLKTTLPLILDANPGLEPKTMQVGREIFIPMVPNKS